MVFHWGLSDNKFPQVPWTLLSILAVLNNAVVWMVSIHPPTSKSSAPFNSPLVTAPNASITIGTIVTFMFHSFFQFPSKVEVLILLFAFFQFYSVVSRYSEVHNFAKYLPPSFLDTYSLSTSSLRSSALCMVISSLVLWSICLNSGGVNLQDAQAFVGFLFLRAF